MIENRTVAAIIVAAGSSTRMGFDKLMYDLDGQTVLVLQMEIPKQVLEYAIKTAAKARFVWCVAVLHAP